MTPVDQEDGARGAAGWWLAFALFVAVWVVVAGGMFAGFRALAPHALFDSDCYMRLLRTEAVVADGEYPFQAFKRSNPPAGETTPWTLPQDILLGISALPLRLLGFSWRDALWSAGYWTSPMLFLVAGAIFLAALIRVGGMRAAIAGAILLPLAQAVINMYFPARPDHHALLHLSWIVAVTAAVSWVENPTATTRAHIAGVATALMLWASMEGGYLAALLLGLLGLNTVLRREGDGRKMALDGLRSFIITLAGSCAVFIVIERGGKLEGAWFWDVLSTRHLCGLGVVLTSTMAFRRFWLAPAGWTRWLAGGLTAAIALAAFTLTESLQPAWMRDEGVRRSLNYLLYATSDNLPFHRMEGGWLPSLLLWFGAPLLIWPIALIRWLRFAPVSVASRWFVAALSVGYVPMGLLISRWNLYGSTCLAFLAAWWLAFVSFGWQRRRSSAAVAGVRREALLGMILAAVAVGLAGRFCYASMPREAAQTGGNMALDEAIRELRAKWLSGGASSRRVLAPIAWGPALMYFWDARVLGTPYYRNACGMEQSFAWFYTDEPSRAIEEMRASGWTWALVPAGWIPPEFDIYRKFLATERGAAAAAPGCTSGPTLIELLCGPREALPPQVICVTELSNVNFPTGSLRLLRLDDVR